MNPQAPMPQGPYQPAGGSPAPAPAPHIPPHPSVTPQMQPTYQTAAAPPPLQPLGAPGQQMPMQPQVAVPQMQPMQQPGMAPMPPQGSPMPAGMPQGQPMPGQAMAGMAPGQPGMRPVQMGQPGMPGQPGVIPPQHTVPQQTNPNSTQNTLQIAEIRDGIVIMNDGTFRSVVMVKSINFDLMSPQEQEAVEYSYQSFLNSLYFPVQIFIRSQKVDLGPYIDKLDKIRSEHDNMLLALLMDDYIGYIDALSQQTNIMDKNFFVVIPFFPTLDAQKALSQSKNFFSGLGSMFSSKEAHVVVNEADLEKAKTELRNRVQAVLQGLMQCGVQGLPLDTQELIELYYDMYNPDTATRQPLKNFNDLTADVITKGIGRAPQPHLQGDL